MFMLLLSSADFFSKLTFFLKKNLSETQKSVKLFESSRFFSGLASFLL